MQRASRIEVLALVVVTACGDSSADDGSSMSETHGSFDGPDDGDPGDGDPGDGDSGDGDPGDGDPGDGDPGDGDPGDGDGDPPPGCGDGMLDPGEACDDGNNEPGDGCTALCQAPGTLIWEVVTDLDGGLDDVGWAVAVDLAGSSNHVVQQDTSYLLARFDYTGELEWSTGSVQTERPSLVIGPAGHIVAGGLLGSQGVVRAWDSAGEQVWSTIVAVEGSSILGLAIDAQGHVVAAGYHPGPSGFLARYDGRGLEVWAQLQVTAGALGPVAAGERIWVDRRDSDRLERYGLDGATEPGIEALDGDVVRDLVVDAGGQVYVLTEGADGSGFAISRYDANGALVWTQTHGGNVAQVSMGGLALLPGGLLVVGSTNVGADASDGLLVWYDRDGGPLVEDVVIDLDDVDALHDVAITPFNYAVAVGERRAAGADSDLWIRKFEI